MPIRAAYRSLIRPALFALDAERAHGVAAVTLRVAHASRLVRAAMVPVFGRPPASVGIDVLGRRFASPVVLAAGFDKNAVMYNGLFALGFGGVEVGTVTALAQPGNPRPRLFRLRDDRAVVNRMGFNNAGAAAMARSIAAHPPVTGGVLGVNLGKSKATELARAADDYADSARRLGALAHYIVLNVSSPNTPGLRSLQSVDALGAIVDAVQRELAALAAPPPLLVKIAPDLADEDIDAVADLALAKRLAGLIATNTTVRRDGLRSAASLVERAGIGGLSGAPLRERALTVLRRLRARTGGRLVLVGVGGIETDAHAWEMIRAGASLVQVYTAMIYEGPTLARDLNAGLARRLAAGGFERLAQAVGTER